MESERVKVTCADEGSNANQVRKKKCDTNNEQKRKNIRAQRAKKKKKRKKKEKKGKSGEEGK